MRRLLLAAAGAGLAGLLAVPSAAASPPSCAPGEPPVVLAGSATPDQAKTYRYHPFEVLAGTTRVEVSYRWTDDAPTAPSSPLTATTFDLGLWDADGVGTAEGFRGWSGDRQGRLDRSTGPVYVQADVAERGYHPGAIEVGVWNVEIGVGAVAPSGATYEIHVRCTDPETGPTPPPRPVDATHVAVADAGWYHGDFHMHGVHSNPDAPDWNGFVSHARAAALDFLPITEYVTTRHHDELGPLQAANPDLVLWPGREIITYFGHANTLGETPGVVDYRHGHDGVTLADIQRDSVAAGALFQVNHPEIFPGPVFSNFCRGCEFTLDEEIDWDLVDTLEVLTGPILVDDTDIGGPGFSPTQIQNPFVQPAIDLWHDRLLAGHRITAVSGSDDKLGPGLGSSATAVYARELSRPALIEAIRNGRAYVRTRGVASSPSLELTAVAADGTTGRIGDSFTSSSVEVTAEVRGGSGQTLLLTRDGVPAGAVPITDDHFLHRFTATASDRSGPLGTFWRVDVADPQSLTVIGNPIFVGAPSA